MAEPSRIAKNWSMSVTSFFSSIRSWGFERHADAPIAGVAGGLATAWRVDPLLIRAGFLALTFVGGAGPMLYALCWAFLPDERTKNIHMEEAMNGRFPAGLVGAMSLFLITFAVFSSLSFFGALGLIITAVFALLCYGSITGRNSRPPGDTPDTNEYSSNTDGMESMSENTPPTTPPITNQNANPDREHHRAQQRARAESEAQRAKAAREHSRNERVELRARRRLSGRTGAVLLAIALLAVAAFIVVLESGAGAFADVSTVAAGIGFAALLFGFIVLGVGIFGRRGGFLSFVAILASIVAIPPMATITTTYSNSTVATTNYWVPRTSADIGTGYSVHMGEASIDFSQFNPDDAPEHVNVASSMASLHMEFDDTQKVAIISNISMGSLDTDSPGAVLSNGRSLDDRDIGGFTRDTIFIGGIDSVSEADIIINADISMSGASIHVQH